MQAVLFLFTPLPKTISSPPRAVMATSFSGPADRVSFSGRASKPACPWKEAPPLDSAAIAIIHADFAERERQYSGRTAINAYNAFHRFLTSPETADQARGKYLDNYIGARLGLSEKMFNMINQMLFVDRLAAPLCGNGVLLADPKDVGEAHARQMTNHRYAMLHMIRDLAVRNLTPGTHLETLAKLVKRYKPHALSEAVVTKAVMHLEGLGVVATEDLSVDNGRRKRRFISLEPVARLREEAFAQPIAKPGTKKETVSALLVERYRPIAENLGATRDKNPYAVPTRCESERMGISAMTVVTALNEHPWLFQKRFGPEVPVQGGFYLVPQKPPAVSTGEVRTPA